MSLFEDLQRQRVAGPASRKFDPKAWCLLVQQRDLSLDELTVVAMGLLFHGSLAKLRDELKFVASVEFDSGTKRRALVAMANREGLVAERLLQEAMTANVPAGGTIELDRAATATAALPAGDFRLEEISDSVVEGAARLVEMCALKPGAPWLEQALPRMASVARDINVANAYLGVEALWMDIVWKRVRPVPGRTPMAFVPQEAEAAAFEAISRHRHTMTSAQQHAFAFTAHRHSRVPLTGVPVPTWSIAVDVTSGRSSLQLVKASELEVSTRYANRRASVPPYYASILSEPSVTHPLLTLGLVLDAFEILSSLANALAQPVQAHLVQERDDSELSVPITAFAPLVLRSQLVELLGPALGTAPSTAEQLVGFFCFADPHAPVSVPKADAWSAPLVYVGEDHLVVMLHPPRHGNLRWLLDQWLKRLGFPLDFRGTEFEVHARQTLVTALNGSALAGNAMVHPAAFGFTTAAGRYEDIDVLGIVNDLIVVGEAKCFLEPVAPIERRNHHEKIVEAALQVQRKAEAVRTSSAEFLTRAKQLGITIPKTYRVMPLVVLNHALGAGQLVESVPVVDLKIYELFFQGSMQWHAVVAPDGTVESSVVERFFDDPSKAAASLESYVASPPQVRHLRTAISARRCQLLFPAADLQVIETVVLDVDVSKIEIAAPSGADIRAAPST